MPGVGTSTAAYWSDEPARIVWRAPRDESQRIDIDYNPFITSNFRLRGWRIEGQTDGDAVARVGPGVVETTAEFLGDVDRFSLSVVKGAEYHVVAEDVVDASVRLYSGDGLTLLADGGERSQNGVESFRWIAPADGEVILDVGMFAPGAYRIKIEETRDDQAEPGTVVFPGSLHGRVDYALDFDRFEFEAEPGVEYRFKLDEGNDVHIDLRGDGGWFVCGWGVDSRCTVNSGGEIVWRAAESRKVYLGVYHFPDTPTTYAVRAGADRWAAGADVEAAEPLVDGAAEGRVTEPGDAATFWFDAHRGNKYTFAADVEGGLSAVVNVWSAAGERLATGWWSEVSWIATEGGRYYVSIGAIGAAAGYGLSMAVAEDDQAGVAGRLENPGRVEGRIDYLKDVDWFEFEAEAGKVYVVDVEGVVEVGIERVSHLFVRNFGYGERHGLTFRPEASGTYRLEVTRRWNAETGLYAISVREPEDDQAGPVKVMLLQPMAGRFDYPYDRDVFLVEAKAGVVYGVEFESDEEWQWPFVRVFDEAGRMIWAESNVGMWYAPVDGVYRVEIESDDAPGDYAVIVRANPDDVGELTSINWRREVRGELGSMDVDRLWFVAEAGRVYDIEVVWANRWRNSEFSLQDSAGSSLEHGEHMRWRAEETGLYFLVKSQMYGKKFAYHIRIEEVFEEDVVVEVPESEEVEPAEVDEEFEGEELAEDEEWWWDGEADEDGEWDEEDEEGWWWDEEESLLEEEEGEVWEEV